MAYQQRDYRSQMRIEGLKRFEVRVQETDLMIFADCELVEQAYCAVKKVRETIEAYIVREPAFLHSLRPVEVPLDAPQVIVQMAKAAHRANVGPMAAVAGMISEFVGKELLQYSDNVIVENGGDNFISCRTEVITGIYVKDSVFSGKLKVRIAQAKMPMGVCTSSGTFGHSLSLGKADAAVVLSADAALADAAATRLANEIKEKEDIEKAIGVAQCMNGVAGVVLIKDDCLGIWGDIEIVK